MTGLCMCGCGFATKRAAASNTRRGHVRGEPLRFVHGHNNRGKAFTDGHRRAMSEAKRGAKNPAWIGGRTESEGYIKVKVGRRYEMEHRLVVAQGLGRSLLRDEVVHHIDLDRANNAPENLAVVNRHQHMKIHRYIDGRGMTPRDALDLVLGGRT